MNKERKERIGTLQNAVQTLKEEFVGLDSIIDELSEAISSWYITPEVITRPVVISLWGMTGTGKSSVVRRLIELLDLKASAMFFDCGECTAENKDISSSICDSLGMDFEEDSFAKNQGQEDPLKNKGKVFVFDEFQYARTINEEGCEDVKSSLRPIWSIVDSGILDMTDSYSWSYNKLISFIDDMIGFAAMYPDIKVEKNVVKDRDQVKAIMDNLGFIHYDRFIPQVSSIEVTEEKDDEDDLDPYRPVKVIDQDKLKTIIKRLNSNSPGEGIKAAEKIYTETWTIEELAEWLAEVKTRTARTKQLDCSDSLVFVIGNLDEAFHVSDETNPDMDADMFYSITSKVGVSDIKEALKKRFRPEQIARLGNNMIKYPAMSKANFKEIIKREVDRIIKNFNEKIDPVKITIKDNVYELLYCEGVFPTQGVRPIFTTINTILTPYLSKILIEKEASDTEVTLDIRDDEDCWKKKFKVDETWLTLTFSESKKVKEYKHLLQLGSARNPQNRKKRFASSIHEVGHAIVYSWLTGEVPDTIVSVSTDHGGFCSTYNEAMEGEIDSREDVRNSVMISMAGYLAETMIFSKDKVLMGSGNDIERAWQDLSDAAYKLGYFINDSFSSYKVEQSHNGVPGGLNDENGWGDTGTTHDKLQLSNLLKEEFKALRENTTRILKKERTLLMETARHLGEFGAIDADKFKDYIKAWGNSLTMEYLEKRKLEVSPDYYERVLMKG